MDRTANAARWGDKPLLNGDAEHSKVVLQVGTGNEEHDRITIQMPNLVEILQGLEGFSVITPEAAGASIAKAKTAIDRVSAARAQLGAAHNRLNYTANALSNTAENLQNAESRIRDADIAKEMSRFVRSTTLAQAAQMVFSHSMQSRYRILQLLRSMY